MDKKNLEKSNKPPRFSALKEVFNKYAEETITEEQVLRILAPIISMIREGNFDKKQTKITNVSFTKILLPIAAVFVLAMTVIFTLPKSKQNTNIIILDPATPLANFSIVSNSLSGKVVLEDKGLDSVELQLINDNEESISTTTDSNGIFSFDDIPNGKYQLLVILPEGLELLTDTIDGYIVIGSTTDIIFNSNTTVSIENVEIEVWKKN